MKLLASKRWVRVAHCPLHTSSSLCLTWFLIRQGAWFTDCNLRAALRMCPASVGTHVPTAACDMSRRSGEGRQGDPSRWPEGRSAARLAGAPRERLPHGTPPICRDDEYSICAGGGGALALA